MISVLYVDDEKYLLDLTKIFLEKTGHFQIDTVASPREALKLLEERTFDALVSDYEMPDLTGLELLEAVRTTWQDLPFIIFTGRGREDVVIRAFELGADFYLQKGGDPSAQFAELAHKIRQAVRRRQGDQALRSSEEKFSKVFSLNPIAMAIAEYPGGRFVEVNEVFLEYCDRRREEVIGKNGIELGLFGDPSDFDRMIEAFEKGEKIRNIEIECVRKDGERRSKLFSADIFRMGKETYILSFAVDITDRKRSEKELRARDAILQAVAESAGKLIDARDLEPAITSMLGSLGIAAGVDRVYIYVASGTPERCLAKLAYEWAAPDVRPWIDDSRFNLVPYREMGYTEHEKLLRNGKAVVCSGTTVISREPGSGNAGVLPNAVVVPILTGKKPWGVIGFESLAGKEWSSDVLDVLKTAAVLIGSVIESSIAKKTLTDHEDLYRTVFRALPNGIVITDTKGTVTFASEKAFEMVGAGSETSILGTAAIGWVAPEFRETARADVARLLWTGKQVTSQYRVLRRDGSSFPAEISCSLLHDTRGDSTGIVSIVRDVSSIE